MTGSVLVRTGFGIWDLGFAGARCLALCWLQKTARGFDRVACSTAATDVVSEPVHDLLSNSAKKAKWMNCRLVLSL
ncbi:hypothetical protein VDF34_21055, partial [Xanthomonas campestris pv. raphani]|nr:hypothetical protein [Xanthomonas campestris pv. raphani]